MKLKTIPNAKNFDLWLGQAAPRYTSYPPAPFFTTQVGADDYALSLKGLPENDDVSLYIHIPFCRSLCLYCGCNTQVTQRVDRVQEYLDSLKREIAMVSALTGKRRVNFLHFGGGTPNLLGAQDMRDLFACLGEHFDLGSAREIAMELDPRVAGEDQAKILADCGVTRVSLGAQDFNPEVQAIVHRHQPYERVAELCAQMRDAGITRINIDLMYGLPKQTPETITATARQVCTLRPARVALFSYAHVPQIKKHQLALEEHGLPNLYERLALDRAAREVLTANRYRAIGIDHFAQEGDSLTLALDEGRLHRSFQGYTDDDSTTLIGLGCSSISQTKDGYFQSEHDERAYQGLIALGKLPTQRGFLLSPEDRLRRAIIEQLMGTMACDVAAICQRYNFPIENLASDFERLKPYEDAGLIALDSATLRLTTPYRMALRVISKAFDPYSLNAPQPLSSRTS